MITRKSLSEIATMRQAGIVVAEVHALCARHAVPGVSTAELDEMAEAHIRARGGKPTFFGYHGFPASICASINDEVVHGIPSRRRRLREGDILKIDVGVTLDGLVADAAVTIPVGRIADDVARLLEVTREALMRGIAAARPGRRIGDVGHAIEAFVRPLGYGIVQDYGGHGVGRKLHEEPHIPNHGRPGSGPRIRAGHCLAIEPMINLGGDEVHVRQDRWTVVTNDRRPSAHFEHTIAVTEAGPVLLTLPEGAPQPFAPEPF